MMAENPQVTTESGLAATNFVFLSPDVRDFIDIVLRHDLYTRMGELAGDGEELAELPEYQRRQVRKGRTFHLLYGSSRGRCEYQAALNEHFPGVARFRADHEKRHEHEGYKELSREMQRRESDWMYGRVCKRLTREYPQVPLFPIHDSLMTIPEHVETVEGVMSEELQELGIPAPVLNKEDYTDA